VPDRGSSSSFAVSDITGRRILELSAWRGAEPLLRERIASLQASGTTVLPVAANCVWVVSDGNAVAESASDDLAQVELSDALVTCRLTGSERLAMLGRLLPVDLHASRFATGDVVTSHIHGITVTVHNGGEFVDVYVRRSLAASLRHMLERAATR
jgi:heterotetrameric sarcosine oxidase gamma subunit